MLCFIKHKAAFLNEPKDYKKSSKVVSLRKTFGDLKKRMDLVQIINSTTVGRSYGSFFGVPIVGGKGCVMFHLHFSVLIPKLFFGVVGKCIHSNVVAVD